MLIINDDFDPLSFKNTLMKEEPLIVACYCANWCGTCQQYMQAFQELSAQFPHIIFWWIDIEEMPDLLDDYDVENFPTLLMQKGGNNYFFGTLLPHIQHLERLILALQERPPTLFVEGPANLSDLI